MAGASTARLLRPGRRVHARGFAVPVAIAALAVMLALASSSALAQKNQAPPNALQGFSQNRDEPVKIRAASLRLERVFTEEPN